MKVLALDIGNARVGIAYGDTKTKIASPVCVLSTDEVLGNSKNFCSILSDYMPEKFVIGLPKSMDGEENDQAKHVREISDKIAVIYNMDIEFIDERLSSVEAKNILREQGLSEKEMRGKIDSVAASIFLETWMSAKK